MTTHDDKPVPCVFCGLTVVATDFVVCRECGAPAHRSCWSAESKCPVFECRSDRYVEPALALFRSSCGADSACEPPEVRRSLDLLADIQLLESCLEPPTTRMRRLLSACVLLGLAYVSSLALLWPAHPWMVRMLFHAWFGASVLGFFWSSDDRKVIRAVKARLEQARIDSLVTRAIVEMRQPVLIPASRTSLPNPVPHSLASFRLPAQGNAAGERTSAGTISQPFRGGLQ